MGVVQIVGRADADVVDAFVAAPQLVDVPIEPLELREEMRLRKMAVDDADGIIGIEGNPEIAPQGLDGLHVTRGDVAGGADQGEACHGAALTGCVLAEVRVDRCLLRP